MKKELFYKLVDKVCQLYGFTRETLFSKTKQQEVVDARHMALGLAIDRGVKPAEIKRYLDGEGYHMAFASIGYAVQTINQKMEDDGMFEKAFNNIKNQVK
jgi:chromosomal replication initiation ATPase DnaA